MLKVQEIITNTKSFPTIPTQIQATDKQPFVQQLMKRVG
jgi:hypothetical protein